MGVELMEETEKTIQDALLRLLKRHGIEPPHYWATVRVLPSGIGRSTRYTVVIAYPAAKTALCEVLNFLTGGQEDEGDAKAGVWVFSEPQVNLLCALMAGSHEEQRQRSIRTLGDVLYADKANSIVSEEDWTALVQSIASGDQRALLALYDRTHRIVFTLIVRITNDRETAQELTLDVFHGIWRGASTYDPANESVLGWIMNQARSRAMRRLQLEQDKKRIEHHPHHPVLSTAARDPAASSQFDHQGRLFRNALTLLTHDERQAIETAFFGDVTHAAATAQPNQHLATIKTHICSGLNKLRQVLITA
jgi:RNA polymerase sigma-70 factor (ECF subfamily)